MKRYAFSIIMLGLFLGLFAHMALAQTAAPDTTPAADLLKDIAALRAAKAAGDKTGLYMAAAALVALVLKFVIDFLKSLKTDELSDKGKQILPWAISCLGVIVAVVAKYGAGETWVNSIILGGGAPGAVLFHELIDALKNLILKKPGAGLDIKKAMKNTPPTPPAAALVLFALLSLGAVGCKSGSAAIFGINFAACGLGALPKTAANVLPVIQDALQHDPNFQTALDGLALEVGVDVVTCAVKSAVATWAASSPHAALAPEAQQGLSRGQLWLIAHGVTK